jgi:hypothetical protein
VSITQSDVDRVDAVDELVAAASVSTKPSIRKTYVEAARRAVADLQSCLNSMCEELADKENSFTRFSAIDLAKERNTLHRFQKSLVRAEHAVSAIEREIERTEYRPGLK